MGRVKPLSCDQGRAEGTHDAGDVGTNDVAAGDFLERAQHSVVIEGAALYNDVLTQLRGRGYLHDLEQRVFDDGIGKTGGDIGYARALLLRLLDAGVHENRAARAKVNGILRKKSCLCKIHHRVIQGLRKGLDKRAAPGGTGLVERNGIHGSVANADALHVLAADVEDAVHLRVKIRCTVIVRDGFDLAPVQPECGLHQRFAIAGGAAAGYGNTGRELLIQIGNPADGRFDGRAVVGGIEGPEKLAVFADESKLCRGGAGINAKEGLSLVGGEALFGHAVAAVTGGKCVVIVLAREQRLHALHLKLHLHGTRGLLQELVNEKGMILFGLEGRAHCREEVRVFHLDGVLLIQMKLADEGRLELG